MKIFIPLSLILLFSITSIAQKKDSIGLCKISGKIIDSISKEPIEYATLTAFKMGTNTIVGGAITDSKGQFVIDNLFAGEYYAKIDFIGYKQKQINNIVLTDNHNTAKVGGLGIVKDINNLKEVTVTGSKNFMEMHLDKFVYNVEKDITSQGGVATDVLKKVPQVSVDVDGNVELLGNTNVRVFINGKPSALFDNNLAEALQTIPASQIKSIEVITSPGAQYDAQGTGGIINIVMKNTKSQSVNGNITLSGGTRLENGSIVLNAHKGKFDVNASVSANGQLKGTTLTTLNRTTTNADRTIDSTCLLQNGQGTLYKKGLRATVGADYELSKKDNISVSLSYHNFGTYNTGSINQNQIAYYPNEIDTITNRTSENTSLYKSLDWEWSYKRKFKKEGQEFNLSYQGSVDWINTNYSQNQSYALNNVLFSGAKGSNEAKDKDTYINADYVQPIFKNATLSFGAKGSFIRANSLVDHYLLNCNIYPAIYELDATQVNNYVYNQDIYASYASVTFPVLKVYNFKLGLRDEETKISFPGINDYLSGYNSIVPSGVVSRKLNNNQTIKLSYARRIQRPDLGSLNPFVDATDPYNLIKGNPYLLPEKVHNVEFSYFKQFPKGSNLLATLYFRYSTDDLQRYIIDTTFSLGSTLYKNVAVSTSKNAGTQQVSGINLSGKLSVSEKLEIRGNAILFNKYIVSQLVSGATSGSFNYRINGNATYQINKLLTIEVYGSFRSPNVEIQGKFPSFSQYSIAMRQMLFKKKLSVAFTTTDAFNKYVDQETSITGQGFSVISNRKIPYQSFGISISYKFGKTEYAKNQEQEQNFEEGGR